MKNGHLHLLLLRFACLYFRCLALLQKKLNLQTMLNLLKERQEEGQKRSYGAIMTIKHDSIAAMSFFYLLTIIKSGLSWIFETDYWCDNHEYDRKKWMNSILISIEKLKVLLLRVLFFFTPSPNIIYHTASIILRVGKISSFSIENSGRCLIIITFFFKHGHIYLWLE